MIKKGCFLFLCIFILSCEDKSSKNNELSRIECEKMFEATRQMAENTHLKLERIKEENYFLKLKIDSLETILSR